MRKVAVGPLSRFQSEGVYQVSVEGNDLILVNHGGQFHCLENRCSHEDFPLEDGEIETFQGQTCIVCPAHGARFSLNGEALSLPATERIKSFEVSVQEGQIYILIP